MLTIEAKYEAIAREKLIKLARRASKLGIEGFEFSISKPREASNKLVVDIEVNIPEIKISGWNLVAVLKHDGKNTQVFPKIDKDPRWARWSLLACDCEHCGRKTRRACTAILQDVNGVEKQVGTTCLKDFSGHEPEEVIWAAAAYAAAKELMDCDEEGGGAGIVDRWTTREFLGYVCEEIENYGYVPASFEHSTRKGAFCAMLKKQTSEERKAVADKHAAQVNAIIAFFEEIEPESDFEHNMKVAALSAELMQAGLVAYAAEYVLKAGRKAHEAKAESQHVGVVGARGDFVLTLDRAFGFDSAYGWVTIYKMLDEGGNVFVWKTTKEIEGIEEGSTLTIKGTIKAHSEYKGTKQTELTRCKVLSVKMADDAA